MSAFKYFAHSILIILSATILTTALNVSQCNDGKLNGYWGSHLANVPNHGDVVTQTYCFCSRPKENRTEDRIDKDLGAMIQIEYYNKDQDTTFALCQRKLCHHSDPHEQVRECRMLEKPDHDGRAYTNTSSIIVDLKTWDGDIEPLAREWVLVPYPRITNDFSFIANTHRFGNEHHQVANFMYFNHAVRNLGPQGGQNYRKINNSVQDVCSLQCREFLHMEVATARGEMQPSFQILNDVDRICPREGCLHP